MLDRANSDRNRCRQFSVNPEQALFRTLRNSGCKKQSANSEQLRKGSQQSTRFLNGNGFVYWMTRGRVATGCATLPYAPDLRVKVIDAITASNNPSMISPT